MQGLPTLPGDVLMAWVILDVPSVPGLGWLEGADISAKAEQLVWFMDELDVIELLEQLPVEGWS